MATKEIQATFSGGEISETALGRVDLDVYAKSLKRARNVYIDNIGYAKRREGSVLVVETPNSDEVKLVDFEFNNEEVYILEFSAGQFRVIKDDVVIATINSSPIDTLTIDQIKEMDYTQSADTLILTHPDVNPIKITRTSDVLWTTESITLLNIPLYAFNGVTTTEPASNITYTADSGNAKLTFGSAVANSDWVGQKIYFEKGGVLRITKFVSSTVVWADYIVEAPNTDVIPSGEWEIEEGYEAVWSATRGYPVSLIFHEGRLWFGGSRSRPQTIWGSVVDDFFNFELGIGRDDQAIELTSDSGKLNAIRELASSVHLQVFTSKGEYYIPSNPDTPITPTSSRLLKTTEHGISSNPISVDGATLYVENSGQVVRQFIYNDVEQTYNAPNVSILAPHLVRNIVRCVSRGSTEESPISIAFLLNSDGTIAVLNTLREQDFRAWTLFETDGEYEDIIELAGEIYTVVKRNIDGVDKRFIERFDYDYKTDCAVKQSSVTEESNWTGFDHLDGETCSVVGDEYVLSDVIPVAGAIESNIAVKEIEVGLLFLAKLVLLPVEFTVTANGQSSLGSYKRVVYLNARLYNSRNVIVGSFNMNYEPAFRTFGSNTFDKPIPLYSGWKKVFVGGSDRDTDITITQSQPLEFNVLAVTVGVS